MRKCLIFLLLLSFFYIFLVLPAGAETFYQVDIERLLKNHPLSLRYDPESGRFKETESEIIDLDTLHRRINSLKFQIKECESQKGRMLESNNDPLIDTDAEETIWAEISKLGLKSQELNSQMQRLEQLVYLSGVPPASTVKTVIKTIYDEVRKEYRSKLPNSDELVILNELPGFVTEIPTIKHPKDGLFNFLNTCDVIVLQEYLKHNYQIGMLFKSVTRPILYKRSN